MYEHTNRSNIMLLVQYTVLINPEIIYYNDLYIMLLYINTIMIFRCMQMLICMRVYMHVLLLVHQ